MKLRQYSLATLFVFTVAPIAHAVEPVDFDFYASLRLQYEAANPDNASSYDGFRDAYSRIGVKAAMPLANGMNAFAQLELPLDLANGAVQDPYDNDEDIRIAKIGIETAIGTFAYGQDWMPYYNAIAYPVDMFSTYYSGFATYTTSRVSDSFYYYSPDFNGLSFGASVSNGGSDDNRYQLTASYSFDATTIAVGLDDVGGSEKTRFYGFSLMHQIGNLSLAAKYELVDSKTDTGFGKDGDTAINLYAGYTIGKNTLKGMIAEVDNFGGTVLHLGVDHAYSDRMTLFAEYYNEEEGAAIPTFKATDAAPDGAGGDVFAVGVRYSF